MKKWYILFLLVTTFVQAQLPIPPGQSGRQPVPDIAQYEKQSLQRRLEAQGTDGTAAFSVATDNFDIHYYRCDWKLKNYLINNLRKGYQT